MKNLIFYLLMIFQSTELLSQGLYSDSALITMSDNVKLSIDTDFYNHGQLVNGGTLIISGDWQNNGDYAEEEEARVILSGFNNQTVYADSINFNDLTIAGSGDKTLAFNTTLSGVLDFASGRLKVVDDTLILAKELSLYGVNDQSYIVGRVFRSGIGELDFPIGTSSTYLPVTLLDVEGAAPLIGMEALEKIPNQRVTEKLTVAKDRYWHMTHEGGYRGGFIKLPYDDSFSVLDTSNIVVAQSVSDLDDFNTLGAGLIDWGFVSGGYVTSKGVANGPYFTIGYTGLEEILPPIHVVNVLTPRQDGKHDFMRVENIELYEGNEVKIYNRNGGLVWEENNYDNKDVLFIGTANTGLGGELPDGNYFYTIQYKGDNLASGFIFLKR